MFRTRFVSILAAVLCFGAITIPAAAAEVDCGSEYCFAQEDFSGEQDFAGILITKLPDCSLGTLLLGKRVLQSGDILTAQQAAQMTFSPLLTELDQTARVEYLPIFDDHVAENAVMTISIRGKADQAPVAEDSAAETYRNLPGTGKLKVSDPEGQTLTYTVTRQPKRGTLTIADDGSFTYTPKKNKVGVDSFTYTAADPAGNVSREATVTVTILKPSEAAPYTDTAGRDCCFTAEWMKHTGIFVGESVADKSCFQPDKEVTRGEFVTMLVKALEVPTDEYLTYTGYEDDIPKWLQPYVAAAVRSGLTAGLPDQETFGANETISGAEVSVLLRNALDLTATAAEAGADVPVWAEAAMAAAAENGFCLEAEALLTREQAALILYQAVNMSADTTPDSLV